MSDQTEPVEQPAAVEHVQSSPTVDPVAFAQRIEGDSWLQAERHATAAGFWGTFQWLAGGLAAVLAAAASASAFGENSTAAGVLALLASATAALVTALRPGDISSQHLKAAASYNALQSTARDLWQFGLEQGDQQDQLRGLTSTWVEVTSTSPRVPRRLLGKTTTFNKSGLNYYPAP